MPPRKKTPATCHLIEEEIESAAPVLHQHEDRENTDSPDDLKRETLAIIRNDQEKARTSSFNLNPTAINGFCYSESPWDYRRPHTLRRWSSEYRKERFIGYVSD